ncbi:hypothetical protein D3C80_2033280 [compost metagenome]
MPRHAESVFRCRCVAVIDTNIQDAVAGEKYLQFCADVVVTGHAHAFHLPARTERGFGGFIEIAVGLKHAGENGVGAVRA